MEGRHNTIPAQSRKGCRFEPPPQNGRQWLVAPELRQNTGRDSVGYTAGGVPVTGRLPDIGRLADPRWSAGNRHFTGTRVRYGAVRQPDRSRFHTSLCSQPSDGHGAGGHVEGGTT